MASMFVCCLAGPGLDLAAWCTWTNNWTWLPGQSSSGWVPGKTALVAEVTISPTECQLVYKNIGASPINPAGPGAWTGSLNLFNISFQHPWNHRTSNSRALTWMHVLWPVRKTFREMLAEICLQTRVRARVSEPSLCLKFLVCCSYRSTSHVYICCCCIMMNPIVWLARSKKASLVCKTSTYVSHTVIIKNAGNAH